MTQGGGEYPHRLDGFTGQEGKEQEMSYKLSTGPDRPRKAIRPAVQVFVDGKLLREIHTGLPQVPYLPADPGRRERLIELIRRANQEKGNYDEAAE